MSIESSLLYTRESGNKDFIHDTYRDFFLAKWFAEKINSGRLLVRQAYEQFWSFEIDSDIWGVEGRSVLPAWQNVIKFLSGLLDEGCIGELVNMMTESYFKIKEKKEWYEFNPFNDNLNLFADCCSSLKIKNKKLRKHIIRILVDFDYLRPARDALVAMSGDDVFKKVEDSLSVTLGDDSIKYKAYVLGKINPWGTLGLFRKLLDRLISSPDRDLITSLSDEEIYDERENIENMDFYYGPLFLDSWVTMGAIKYQIEGLLDIFDGMIGFIPKKYLFEFYKALKNDQDQYVRQFAQKFLSERIDEYEVYLEANKQLQSDKKPEWYSWLEEERQVFGPTQVDGPKRFHTWMDYEGCLRRGRSNEQIICTFANSTGDEQREATFLIKHYKLTEAEPVCLTKLQEGLVQEKTYAVWILGHIGSIYIVPYIRNLLHSCYTQKKKFRKDYRKLSHYAKEALEKILIRNMPNGYNPPVKS